MTKTDHLEPSPLIPEDGTNVNGLGGLETEAHNDKIRNGWRSNGAAPFLVFRKGHADKVASEKEIKDLRLKIFKDEENENNK